MRLLSDPGHLIQAALLQKWPTTHKFQHRAPGRFNGRWLGQRRLVGRASMTRRTTGRNGSARLARGSAPERHTSSFPCRPSCRHRTSRMKCSLTLAAALRFVSSWFCCMAVGSSCLRKVVCDPSVCAQLKFLRFAPGFSRFAKNESLPAACNTAARQLTAKTSSWSPSLRR